MRKFIVAFVLFLNISTNLFATHDLAGYISYSHLQALDYSISVTIYYDSNSPANQRQEIEIDFGDNTTDSISSSETTILNDNLIKRVFTIQHTYNAFGDFTIVVEDPNRPVNISNIDNSVNTPLYLSSELKIKPFANTQNNSPYLFQQLVSSVIVGETFKSNFNTFDDDNDFLFFELVSTRSIQGSVATNYSLPSGVSINLLTGEFIWNTPQNTGNYIFTIKVSECNQDNIVGVTYVDYFLNVSANSNPIVFLGLDSIQLTRNNIFEYTIKPNDTVKFNFKAQSIPNQNNSFSMDLRRNSLRGNIVFQNNNASEVETFFSFQPLERHVRCEPYIYNFIAKNGNFSNSISVSIHVLDSTIINCDTLCGFRVISLTENNLMDKKFNSKIYPNPSSSVTFIEVPEEYSNATFELKIKDLLGREIYNSVEKVSLNKIEFSTELLKSGYYIVSIKEKSTDKISQGKLIVSH